MCIGGFGGYMVDRGAFPDPQAFFDWIHDVAGLELVLNIHDQCGVNNCQTNFALVASAVGEGPSALGPVACAIFNKTFVRALHDYVLETGDLKSVDYWWADYGMNGNDRDGNWKLACAPNGASAHCMHCIGDAAGGMPALWTAYARVSRAEQVGRRGMQLGVYGGLGHHRYPSVGSGDVFEGWETLYVEIYASVVGANVGVEWSHDLGGFMPGVNSLHHKKLWWHNAEMYARWLQAGVFSPIFRTHMCEGGDPSIWVYPNFNELRASFQLRAALLPYIYTAAWAASRTGVLPMHPLYYEFDAPGAYAATAIRGPGVPLQYAFGDAFLVSPITAFVGGGANSTIDWALWCPPGPSTWVDWWTNAPCVPDSWATRAYGTMDTPLLARAGSVVPMKALNFSSALAPPLLQLVVPFARGAQGAGFVYEDDGGSLLYRVGSFALTTANFSAGAAKATLTVVAVGSYPGALVARVYEARFRGVPPSATPGNVTCGGCAGWAARVEQEGELRVLVVDTGSVPVAQTTNVAFTF